MWGVLLINGDNNKVIKAYTVERYVDAEAKAAKLNEKLTANQKRRGLFWTVGSNNY